MDVKKETIQSDGSLEKLKLRTLVRGYLQNKELVGDPKKGEPVNPCMDV